MSVQSGQVIKSYRILEKIDAGGFGAVYRAFQPVIEREVAIKVILPLFANEPQFIQRFEAEAQLVARLEHPHIVPLYDYWRDPDGAYLVMRWLRGGSVRDFLQERNMELDEASRLIDHIAGALTVAHRNGIVHRDLKPENILMDIDGNFYLSDFGIAQKVDTENSTDSVSGSAKYIAPEQLRSQPPTIKSDVYSLGIMLYEALTGHHPFGSGSVSEMIYKQLSEDLPPLAANLSGLPETIDAVIKKATQKEPSQRYETIVDLADAFRDAIGMRRSTMEMEQILTDQELVNPYKGLRSFYEADAVDFFGREALVERLMHRLREAEANFLALVGPSGSGKSSVVRAGLVPSLRQHSITNFAGWYVADMVPGNDPLQNLHAALLSVAIEPPIGLMTRLQSASAGLVWAAERILEQTGGNLLLFIDQFEEIFTQVVDEAARRHFLDLIYRAATAHNGRLFVVVSIRADFFDRPLLYEGIGDLIQSHTQVVLPLNTAELERAITGPARRVGLHVDADLIAAIAADVREEPGALPLLQYALTELFERRDGNRLTLFAYHASGGVQGALARRAAEVYDGLEPQLQRVAEQVFLRLVTLGEGAEDTRRRAKRAELLAMGTEREAVNNILDVFGKYRLLTFDSDSTTREPTVEIAHEALIRNWTHLRQWLDESRSDIRLQRALNQAAQDWAAHEHSKGYLLPGGRLVQFEEWARDTTVALNAVENDFLQASIAEREHLAALEQERQAREDALKKRSRRLLQLTVVIFAIFGLVAIGLAIEARRQNQLAQLESNNAQLARDEALNARATSEVNAESARIQLEIAERRAAEIQNLNLLNIAEDALLEGDSGLAMRLVLDVATSDIISPPVQNTLYDVAYGSLLRDRLTNHVRKITALAITRDGTRLATGSEDTKVIIWDTASKEPLLELTDHNGPINSLAFSADGTLLASAATDATATIWHVATGEVLNQLRGHRNVLTDVAFTPDGTSLLTSSGDDTVLVWDVAAGTPTLQFTEHSDSVRTVAVHPDGELALSAGRDGVLLLWNIVSGEVVRHYEGHDGSVDTLVFSPGGELILSGSADQTLILWDTATGNIRRRLDGHSDAITSVAISPDAQTAISTSCTERDVNRACVQGEVIEWDIVNGLEIRRLIGHQDTVNAAVYHPDGKSVYTASCAERRQAACVLGEVLAWDTQPASDVIFRLEGHTSGVLSAAISSDGLLAVTGAGSQLGSDQPRGDTSLIVWDLATGAALQRLEGHTGDVNNVVFSRDNRTVFSASRDGTIREWDIESGIELRQFVGHDANVNDLALSPDGRRLVSAGDDRMILWDVATGRETQSISDLGENLIVRVVAFSPPGDTFVSGLNNGSIILWNAFGNEIRRFIGHTDDIQALSFSPNGRQLLSAARDTTARLWDVPTGATVRIYHGHADSVSGVVFNRQGDKFLTASEDNTMRLWVTDTGEVIRVFDAHTDDITDVALSRSDGIAVTASADGTARVWRISLAALTNWVEANRYVRALTEDEIAEFGFTLP